MTGPGHYREAERLLKRGLEMSQSDMASSDATGLDIAYERVAEADLAIRGAQVHATLALAAAVAETGGLAVVGALGVPTCWASVLGVKGGAD